MLYTFARTEQAETFILNAVSTDQPVCDSAFHVGGDSTHELSVSCWCQPNWGYDPRTHNQIIEHQDPLDQ
jgi:hypothetical protein